jgi:hypothetical protein
MASYGLWPLVVVVSYDVSEERVTSILWVERVSDLETVLAVTSRLYISVESFHYSIPLDVAKTKLHGP